MTERPNILWLTYEDTSPQFVSCYGMTPVVTSPRIDKLAEEGVRFDQAYATAPVCSASRSAIITGCCNQATGLGHHRSKYPVPRDVLIGFPRYLQEAGYYTTNNQKTDYNIFEEASYIEETWNESSRKAHWRNREEGQSFFSVFNYAESHQSRTMTKPWGWYEENVLAYLAEDERIDPESVAMPPIYRDDPEMRRHMSRTYNSVRLCDKRMGERIDELSNDGLMDDTIIFCFADHGEGIPRGKCNGIGFGYRAAFIAWFPEKYKHLSPWGTGVVTDELVSFEDLAPTVLSLAGIEAPGHMTGRAIMGDRRKPAPDAIFAARDRLDDTPDLCRSAMDGHFVYTRNYFPHLPVCKYQKYSDVADFLRDIRRDFADGRLDDVQSEMVRPTRPLEYLYDIKADPWEIRNLAGDCRYQSDLERLRESTIEHAKDVQDVMFLPEMDMVARSVDSSAYEIRSDSSKNPLSDLMSVADLVGKGAGALSRQVELLGHEDGAVQYWAAVGIYASREELGSHLDMIIERISAVCDAARIELAGAVYQATGDTKAKDILESFMRSKNLMLAHQSIEKVLYMPREKALAFKQTALDALDALKAMDVPQQTKYPANMGLEMYRYLFLDEPLYYEPDLPYIDLDRKGASR